MFQRSIVLTAFVFVASLFLFAQPVWALDGGPKKLKLGDVELHRNGSGYRKKGILSLYECTLYLQENSSNAAAIITANEPMAIRIQITSGFVSQSKMVDALNEGFGTATGGNTRAIAAEIQKFRQCFGDPIQKNDVFVLSYIPDHGVIVHKNGTLKGHVGTNPLEFKKAMFAIWLSDQPADSGLRTSMLGNHRR